MPTFTSTQDAVGYLTGKYGINQQAALDILQKNGGANTPVTDAQIDQWATKIGLKPNNLAQGTSPNPVTTAGGAMDQAFQPMQGTIDSGGLLGQLGGLGGDIGGIVGQTVGGPIGGLLGNLAGGKTQLSPGGNNPVDKAAPTGTAATTAPTTANQQQYNPLVSPLAMSLFFTQNIAPLLDKIRGSNQQNMDQMIGGAKDMLGQVQLPPGIRDILSSSLNRQQSEYKDLDSALAASALTGPALDNLMNQLAATQKQQINAYNATAGTSAANILSGLPGITQPTPTK